MATRLVNFAPGVALVAALLTSCAPLPVTYYLPSGDGVKVAQARCDQAPPYMARVKGGKLDVTAFFDGTSLVVGIFPKKPEHIVIDPGLFEVEADGMPVKLLNSKYWQIGYAVQPVAGAVGAISTGLYIGADVDRTDPQLFRLRIPGFTVEDEPVEARVVEFHREKRVKLRFLIINC